jgi:hydrogenase large subunit
MLGKTAHPYEGMTTPDADMADGYSWCKAPRLGGAVAEVGAIARQVVARNPLALSLLKDHRASVFARVVARMIEMAQLSQWMQQWVEAINPGDAFMKQGHFAANIRAEGLTEAARGALGHWLKLEDGKIATYQIIAPTTWNFSPKDASGQGGACEQALMGATARDGEITPVNVQHIVRSFDPCMVCTVH